MRGIPRRAGHSTTRFSVRGVGRDMHRLDPRHFQIVTLSLFIAYGSVWLDIGIRPENAVAILSTALLTQWAATQIVGLPRFDFLSALITSLSLTLLLRTDLVSVAAIAAAVAILSKFAIRWRGKHVFNPANLAIVVCILAFDRAWISSGQWGSATLAAVVMIGLGMIVLNRARRFETTLAFLALYATLLFGRALWLGDPLAIPLHQLQNGALLIFAFFMISDPRTTPDSALGRMVFGGTTAVVAFSLQFGAHMSGAPIYALVLCAPFTPLIDSFTRGRRYQWRREHISEGV